MARTFNAAALDTGQSRLDIALFTLGWGAVMGAFATWLWFLPRYAVDVPIMDQWDTPALQIIAFWEGRLNWDLLAGQHNDSRKLFPNAVSVALAAVSGGYRPGAEVFVTLVLGAVITVGFALLARRTGLGALGAACLAAVYTGLSLAPRSLIIHLHSLNFERLMADAMLVLALLALTAGPLTWRRLTAAAVAAFAAQFSIAGGVTLWPLLALQIALFSPLSRSRRWAFLGLWTGYAGLALWAYFADFTIPYPNQPRPSLSDVPAGDFLGFVTGFFGNAISADRATAILAGAGMLAVFAALALVLVARRSGADPKNRRLTRAGPWLVIGALPLSQAILATYGRLPYGLDHAFRDDYAHYGVFMAVAVGGLALLWGGRRWRRGLTAVCLVVALGLLAGLASADFRRSLADHRAKFSYAKACLVTARQLPSAACLDTLFPRRLDRFTRFARAAPVLSPGLPQRLPLAGGTPGAVDRLDRAGGVLRAHGWAALDGQPADAVALACADPAGGPAPRLIALVKVDQWRPDLARWRGALAQAGWTLRLSPAPACQPAIFVVDADRGQLRALTPP